MSGTASLCIAISCTDFVRRSEKPRKLNSPFSSLYDSAYSLASLSFSGSFSFASLRQTRSTASFSMAGPVSMKIDASSTTAGVPNNTMEASATGKIGANDLLIVGPGVLGRIVAENWREGHPGSQIYGQTLTSDHHEELIKIGISPSLKGDQVTRKFSYIIFSAPPYGNPDYSGEVSSDTPVVPIGRSPRTDNLLKAEKVVLEAGGCVVRLAGLYKVDRGAHTYWLEKGTHDIRPDHILNLIHYEDAASLSVNILKKKLRSRIFLGCDNHPLSRQELMDLVNKSGNYSKKFEAFTGTSDPLGKKLDNSKTRAELGWEPKYPSFAQFLESLSK
ncbi:hypothetical protein OROMI_005881 [Orobanche minor]